MLAGRASSEGCQQPPSSGCVRREGVHRAGTSSDSVGGFSYIRFEFLPSYPLDVFNLHELEVAYTFS